MWDLWLCSSHLRTCRARLKVFIIWYFCMLQAQENTYRILSAWQVESHKNMQNTFEAVLNMGYLHASSTRKCISHTFCLVTMFETINMFRSCEMDDFARVTYEHAEHAWSSSQHGVLHALSTWKFVSHTFCLVSISEALSAWSVHCALLHVRSMTLLESYYKNMSNMLEAVLI